MHIRRRPFRPTNWQLQDVAGASRQNYLHELAGLAHWDVELEA